MKLDQLGNRDRAESTDHLRPGDWRRKDGGYQTWDGTAWQWRPFPQYDMCEECREPRMLHTASGRCPVQTVTHERFFTLLPRRTADDH